MSLRLSWCLTFGAADLLAASEAKLVHHTERLRHYREGLALPVADDAERGHLEAKYATHERLTTHFASWVRFFTLALAGGEAHGVPFTYELDALDVQYFGL